MMDRRGDDDDNNKLSLLIAASEYLDSIEHQQQHRFYQSESVEKFQKIYSMARYTSARQFTDIELSITDTGNKNKFLYYGIPKLCEFFKSFDPINTLANGLLPVANIFEYRRGAVDYMDMHHVHEFLETLDDRRITHILELGDQNHDALVHAIVSFMLTWTYDEFLMFQKQFPMHRAWVECLLEETRQTIVYATNYTIHLRSNDNFLSQILILRTSIKMLAKYHRLMNQPLPEDIAPIAQTFNIFNYIDTRLVAHLNQFHETLLRHNMCEKFRDAVENENMFYNEFFAEYTDGRWNRIPYAQDCARIITGQACCGKTTLAQQLTARGWSVLSRSDMGTFSGKATEPASVLALHAAQSWVFQRGDVIGDRGEIDNFAWQIIMPLCDPSIDPRSMVDIVLNFVSHHMNENSMRYFAAQNTVIFVDPLPSANRKRMLSRGTGGDANRARINNYYVQSLVYYILARLFGWKVYTVPYDLQTEEYAPRRYNDIVEDIARRFGTPRIPARRHPVSRNRPRPYERSIVPNMVYAKSVGIYK